MQGMIWYKAVLVALDRIYVYLALEKLVWLFCSAEGQCCQGMWFQDICSKQSPPFLYQTPAVING